MPMNSNKHLDEYTSHALFRLTDDGAGGRLQTLKRWLKFRVRCGLCAPQLRRIRASFQAHDLFDLFHQDVGLMLRPLRPYLWRSLKPDTRTDGLLAHIDWLLSRHDASTVIDFYKRGTQVFYTQTFPEGVISVELEPAKGFGREGELSLQLKFNGTAVMRSAFSVLPAAMVGLQAPGHAMVIGNMQGQRAFNQEIKIVTQKMERTRPQNILMTALQGLATGWQLVGMVGVSDHAHVYAGYRSLSQRVGQSYDSLWEELGTTGAVSKAHWELPILWVARSEQEVPSNKRSQLRRKNEIRQKIFDEVTQNSANL